MEPEFRLFTSLRYDPGLARILPQEFKNAGWNAENSSTFYMLDYHRDRMLRAAKHWGWSGAIAAIDGEGGLRELEGFLHEVVDRQGEQPCRLKVVLTQDGKFSHEISPTPSKDLVNLFPRRLPPPGANGDSSVGDPLSTPLFEVLVDAQNTAASAYTHYKTTHRPMYDGARSRAQIEVTDPKEVLLVNAADGTIMEGSTTTPYFWRNGRWVTPPVPRNFAPGQGSGGQEGTTRRWALERFIAVEEIVKADSLAECEECWLSNGVRGFIAGKIRLNIE